MALTATRYAILTGTTDCYRCHQRTPVVGIALPPDTRASDQELDEHGWLNATDVDELPATVASHLSGLPGGANYMLDFSVTAGEQYVLNHCDKCGSKLGDYYMHSEPDGPFSGEVTEGLQVQVVDEPIALNCGYSEGALGLWLEERLDRKDSNK